MLGGFTLQQHAAALLVFPPASVCARGPTAKVCTLQPPDSSTAAMGILLCVGTTIPANPSAYRPHFPKPLLH